jgi:tryptophan-rich hypothetical protein
MVRKQKFPHLIGSKWTALEDTFGWRHFQVVNRKNDSEWIFAELVASCDETARFWVNAKILKDRQRWAAGWLTLEEIAGRQNPDIGTVGAIEPHSTEINQ